MTTREQLDILRHAIGQEPDGTVREKRNQYVIGRESSDHTNCMELVRCGMMRRVPYNSCLSGGGDLFMVTETGREEVARHVEPAPKLTPSQRRYRAFLAADSGLSFGDWLRAARPYGQS